MSKTTLMTHAQNERVSENDPAARPKKRSFTPEYKLSILEQLDAMTEPSARAALVRREGLYSSHIAEWRKARDAGALDGLSAKGRPRRSPEQVEVERLRRRNERLERELADEAGLGDHGKSARALRVALRERGVRRAEVDQVIDQSVIELEPLVGTAKACALVGKSRATLYRQRRPAKPRPPRRRRVPANALSPAERRAVMDVLHRDDYLDLAVAQVWARELDEGCYHCSMSTMYRLLACHGENRERRRQATHPPRIKPELVARRANEVWTWDITMLRGPRRGHYYPLYSIIDIFSRFVPGHLVAAVEAARAR